MRFLEGHRPAYDLTYNAVFIVPSHSDGESRFDVDLSSNDGTGTTIPIVVANMTAVAGRRMAETVARRGGMAVIPQDIPTDVVAEVTSWVKSRDVAYDTPITLNPSDTVGDALMLLPKRSHAAVIVAEHGRPIGIVTERDCAEIDRFTQVRSVMSTNLLTIAAGTGGGAASPKLFSNRRRVARVVGASGQLIGVLPRTGAVRSSLYRPAVDSAAR